MGKLLHRPRYQLCVAIMDGNAGTRAGERRRDRTTPSIIAYTRDGETLLVSRLNVRQ